MRQARYHAAMQAGLSCARLVGALFLLCTSAASAEPLRIDASAEAMRVDGALREWKGASFAELGAGDDAALRFALASQGEGLYLAAEVRDDQHVRAKSAGPGQDAVVLALALPGENGTWRGAEVWLHAGRVGREKALAGVRSLAQQAVAAAPQIKVVEGPLAKGSGYVLEAFLPWKLFAGGELWQQAHATLRYEDADRAGQAKAESVLASESGTRPESWPAIVLGTGQLDLLAMFLKTQALSGVAPRFDARANVAGDAVDERVVIVDKFVLVYGKHFKDGQSYSFYALPYSVGGGLVSAELVDLTGDGRAELLARVRQVNPLGARVLCSVLELSEERIAPLFSIELKKETQGGFLENQLRVDKKARPPLLIVEQGRTQGLTQESYRESPASDVVPILLPWGPLEASSYAYQAGAFVRVAQRENKLATPAPAAASTPSARAAAQPEPAAPTAQSGGDALSQLVFALVKGEPSKVAVRFKQEVNMLGGPKRELVFVHEKRIALGGADLGGVASYLAYGLPLRSEQDLLELTSADLGGDGRGELLARYRQAGADGVTHELLMVLAVLGEGPQRGFRPLLTAEVARRQGTQAILSQVSVAVGVLTIAPGKADGFTRETYPFNNEAMPGIERLLLPWLDSARRYRLAAGRLRAE